MSLGMMQGMGYLVDEDNPWDPSELPTYSSAPFPTAGSGSPPWWALLGPSIINTAGLVTRDIFAPVGASQAAYGAQYRSASGAPLSNDQIAALRYQQQYGGAGGGVGAQVEQFVTKNWILIAIVAGVLFFPGFQRRR